MTIATLDELKSLSLNAKVMGLGVSVALPVLDALIAVVEAAEKVSFETVIEPIGGENWWLVNDLRAAVSNLDLIHKAGNK